MGATTVSLDLGFTDQEQLRNDYHSFANLINVVHAELQLLERMSGPDSGLRPVIRLCEAATRAYKDIHVATEFGPELIEWRSRIQVDLARVTVAEKYRDDGEEAREIIGQVIDDADLRIQTMLARHRISRPGKLVSALELAERVFTGLDREQTENRGPARDRLKGRLHVQSISEARIPPGLAESIGRLCAVVLQLAERYQVEISVSGGARAAISVSSGPLDVDVVPAGPPSTLDSPDAAQAIQSRIAFISCVAGPEATVTVDGHGEPLLRVQR